MANNSTVAAGIRWGQSGRPVPVIRNVPNAVKQDFLSGVRLGSGK